MLILTPSHIGALLQSRRKTLGLSQNQVASTLGLSQNRLSELETQPETMTVQQLLALTSVLGLELNATLRDHTTKPKAEW
jgi:HTH-type transcriptional regulator / antitoxin HipB